MLDPPPPATLHLLHEKPFAAASCRHLVGFASSASMDPSRKNACTGSISGEDHLSALPDSLIHTIMSFLKARQVVQTSVLAKRWRHLWRSVPCLNIDQREFNTTTGDLEFSRRECDKFEDFTDDLLAQRRQEGSLLDTFQLHAINIPTRHMNVGRWVRRGLKFLPRVLRIQYRGRMFLELGSCSCHLRKLHLSGLSLITNLGEQISSCPVLEELELKKCGFNFQKIESLSLKNLIMDNVYDDSMTWGGQPRLGDRVLVITAPHLSSLHLNFMSRDIFLISVNEMLSLVKASIHVQNWCRHTIIHNNQYEILSNLFNATSLELVGFHTMVVSDKKPNVFPTFENLTTLLLDKCDISDEFQILRDFLQNSPNLKMLTVQHCMLSKGSEGGKEKAKWKKIPSQCQDMVDFQCLELKCTEIIYRDGDDIQQLVNVLLDMSERLPNNTIKLTQVSVTE